MGITAASPVRKGGLLRLWALPRTSIRHSMRVWRRNFILYQRTWKISLAPQFLNPLFYLVAMGFALGAFIGKEIDGYSYVQYIGPGLAVYAAMNAAAFELTFNTFIKMNFSRIYDAVIATPVEPQDVALGEVTWAVTRSVLYGAIFVFIMFLLGHVAQVTAPLAVIAFALTGLSIGLVALIYTSLVADIDLFSYFFNLFLIPLFLFSGIFFPIDVLPELAQQIAWFTPLLHAVNMSRALILTGEIEVAIRSGIWLTVFSLILAPVAINLFRRRLVL
jgi:lipooligosaccharide transport system permease protein